MRDGYTSVGSEGLQGRAVKRRFQGQLAVEISVAHNLTFLPPPPYYYEFLLKCKAIKPYFNPTFTYGMLSLTQKFHFIRF